MIKEFLGTGKRKTAVSSVRLRPGSGNVKVNGCKFEVYFPQQIQRDTILAPFEKIGDYKQYDVVIRVKGGGLEAQAMATRLGVSRALLIEDENRKAIFKPIGYLTRDSRKKERKKYGRKGARRGFQFSKR